MDDKFRMRLYALTCVVCIAWLAQSISSDLNDGTLATAPCIILIVCIVGAIAYTGFSAAQLWMISDKDEDRGEEDDFGADDVDKSENSSESDGIKLVNAL